MLKQTSLTVQLIFVVFLLLFGCGLGNGKEPASSTEIQDAAKEANYTDLEIETLLQTYRAMKNTQTDSKKGELIRDLCLVLGAGGVLVDMPESSWKQQIDTEWQALKDENLKKQIDFWKKYSGSKTNDYRIQGRATKNACVLYYNAQKNVSVDANMDPYYLFFTTL